MYLLGLINTLADGAPSQQSTDSSPDGLSVPGPTVHTMEGTGPHSRVLMAALTAWQSCYQLLHSSTCAFLCRSQSAQECQVPAD